MAAGTAAAETAVLSTICIFINGVRRTGLHGAISTGRLSGSIEVCKRQNRAAARPTLDDCRRGER